MTPDYITVYHKTCDEPAMLARADLSFEPQMRMRSADFLHINGDPILAYTIMTCDSCGRQTGSGTWRLSRLARNKGRAN